VADTDPTSYGCGLTPGMTLAEAIAWLRDATRTRGAEVLNISEYRFISIEDRLRRIAPDPITPEVASALLDAIHRRRKLDTVLEWIERQPMSWAEFDFHREARLWHCQIEQRHEEFKRWDEMRQTLGHARLQADHSADEDKARHLANAVECPLCQTPPDRLTWTYFTSSPESWRNLCGRAGWAVVCEPCQLEVSVFIEMLN
jgi:hypothetical protein